MLKEIIGACLIVAAGIGSGALLVWEKEQRYAQLCGVTNFISYIRDSVKRSRTPLDRIFISYADKALEDCGFMAVIRNRSITESCRERWKAAVMTLRLEAEQLQACELAGVSLGTLPINDELATLDRAYNALEKERDAALQALKKDKKMIYSICSMAGLALAIILI